MYNKRIFCGTGVAGHPIAAVTGRITGTYLSAFAADGYEKKQSGQVIPSVTVTGHKSVLCHYRNPVYHHRDYGRIP